LEVEQAALADIFDSGARLADFRPLLSSALSRAPPEQSVRPLAHLARARERLLDHAHVRRVAKARLADRRELGALPALHSKHEESNKHNTITLSFDGKSDYYLLVVAAFHTQASVVGHFVCSSRGFDQQTTETASDKQVKRIIAQ
jgi:hypothetical protein